MPFEFHHSLEFCVHIVNNICSNASNFLQQQSLKTRVVETSNQSYSNQRRNGNETNITQILSSHAHRVDADEARTASVSIEPDKTIPHG